MTIPIEFFTFIELVITLSGLTLVITRSKLFRPLRKQFEKEQRLKNDFLADLTKCPMCFGAWAGAIGSTVATIIGILPYTSWWLSLIVLFVCAFSVSFISDAADGIHYKEVPIDFMPPPSEDEAK